MKFKEGDEVIILKNSNNVYLGGVGVVISEADLYGYYMVHIPSERDWYFLDEDELALDTPLTRFLAGLDTKQNKK